MAKTLEAPVVRAARPKSAAQLVRRDRNVAQAAERLMRLQKLQSLAKELRAKGYTGRTDQDVVNNFNESQKSVEAADYVAAVFAVPVSGVIIRRWLKDRVLQSPENVNKLIERFLSRDGSDGGKDNSEHRRNVEDALRPVERIAA